MLVDFLDERGVHDLIARLEKAATKGHGTDVDRALMAEAAQFARLAVGLGPTDALSHLPKPLYPPVKNEPAAGHSLPYSDDDRKV